MKTILKISTNTINRGEKLFTISQDKKGKFFAHEIGNKTQWAKVFGSDERLAHRLNPSGRFGNQYGTFWRVKGMPSIEDCIDLIIKEANTRILIEGIDYNVK